MLIGTKQRKAMMEKEFNIYIGNENIQNVNIQKLLGICLDHNLDWKNQIDYICKNISSRLFLFAKTKRAARIILDAPFFTPKQQLFDSKMDIYYY